MKLQQQEISLLHENLNRQRQESASIRERQRKYEEELTKRLRAARQEISDLKGEFAQLSDQAQQANKELEDLRKINGEDDAR